LTVGRWQHGGGVQTITYLQPFLDYLATLNAFQWLGLIAASAAVVWSIWWAYQPD
jgi:hypothetical protein